MNLVASRELVGDESEAEIAAWLVEDGESVEVGQPVAELETGKARVELPAPVSGTLRVIVAAGEVVELGVTIGMIQ